MLTIIINIITELKICLELINYFTIQRAPFWLPTRSEEKKGHHLGNPFTVTVRAIAGIGLIDVLITMHWFSA